MCKPIKKCHGNDFSPPLRTPLCPTVFLYLTIFILFLDIIVLYFNQFKNLTLLKFMRFHSTLQKIKNTVYLLKKKKKNCFCLY